MRDLTLTDLARRWWRPAVAVTAVVLAVVWRLVKNDLGAPPNLELSTAAAFLAAGVLRHRAAALAPLGVVAASDLLLGNTSILAFTWSAWAVIGLGSLLTRRTAGWRRFAASVAFGVGGTAVFFLWTNSGVWALGSGALYPRGWDGLLASYTAGLPFLRPQLLGNLVLVPAAAGVVALVERLERARVAAVVPVG
ncbi:hypothetical protein ET495_06105 [Xylanimonas allomyrinae]|uniref:ECF transporter S component n=1 Tax=Xylanimonas allomyrinae TaxID=2509459 RepID=A0A4P6EXV8_9MICO|nr:DUF6580 family putative transport protein [Xylanimonas allomyrinae]QAY62888.1 hypothetical protein ET495_06105 [Xylanimonas allomyrinae]